MARDISLLASDLHSFATGLAGSELMRDVLTQVGVEAKKELEGNVRRDLGSDMRFSGWKKAGKPATGFEFEGNNKIVFEPRRQGTWQVLNNGRTRGSKYVRKRKRTIGWGPTRGHDTWDRAWRSIERDAAQTMERKVMEALQKLWGR